MHKALRWSWRRMPTRKRSRSEAVRPARAGRRPQHPSSPAEALAAPLHSSHHIRPRHPLQYHPSGRPLRLRPLLRVRHPRQQHPAPRHRRRRIHPLDPSGPNALSGPSLPRHRVARHPRALNRPLHPMLSLKHRQPAQYRRHRRASFVNRRARLPRPPANPPPEASRPPTGRQPPIRRRRRPIHRSRGGRRGNCGPSLAGRLRARRHNRSNRRPLPRRQPNR